MGSYYLRRWHMRWFDDHMGKNVQIRDLGEEIAGFSLSGPKSRQVIEKMTDGDVAALPFMGCGTFDIGLLRCKVGRLSVSGELGYEIHCRMGDHATLRKALLAAGADDGVFEYGFNAMLSLRLEKSYGIWSAEFTQGYTPGMTGMDRWIDFDKQGFIGRDAALAERNGNGPAKLQVTLEVAAVGADASGYEPVWQDGKKVGFVTSGGFGHTQGKSLAMVLVDAECAKVGTALTTHIVGVERKAKVIAPSPYDPNGKALRV
jgi:dimethylglycine dehydrogenase